MKLCCCWCSLRREARSMELTSPWWPSVALLLLWSALSSLPGARTVVGLELTGHGSKCMGPRFQISLSYVFVLLFHFLFLNFPLFLPPLLSLPLPRSCSLSFCFPSHFFPSGYGWPLDYHFVFNMVAVLSLGLIFISLLLPKSIEKKRQRPAPVVATQQTNS